jgi:hypothetical protein
MAAQENKVVLRVQMRSLDGEIVKSPIPETDLYTNSRGWVTIEENYNYINDTFVQTKLQEIIDYYVKNETKEQE